MALIDNYLKKKDKIDIKLDRPKTLLIDKYVTRKEVPFEVEPEKESISLIDRIKGVGVKAGKLFASSGIEVANVLTSTLDFAADFMARKQEKKMRRPSIVINPLISIPIGKETERSKKLADDWKDFYSNTIGGATEKMKSFTEDLRKIDFIQPSEKWQNLSTKEKFSPKNLPETVFNLGPGLISSFGLYAINVPLGVVTTVGSVGDDIKTIAIESGIEEEKAENLGLATGFAVVALDKIVPSKLFSPGQKKAFIGGFLKRVVKAGLLETITEISQENIQLFVESTLRDDLKMDEVVFRNAMAGLGGLLGGVGAETTVSFVNGVRSGEIGGIDDDTEVKIDKKFDKKLDKKEIPVVNKKEASKFVSAKDFADAQFGAKEGQQIGNINADRIIPRDPVDRNSKEYLDLKVDVKKNGFKEPVRVTVEGKEIITTEGSHRVTVAQELDIDIPVIVNKGEIEGLKTISDQFTEATKVEVKKAPVEKEVVVKKPPVGILYHGTSSNNRSSITKQGFKAVDPDLGVSLTDDISVAKEIAKGAAGADGSKPVVMRVDVTKAKPVKRFTEADPDSFFAQEREFTVFGKDIKNLKVEKTIVKSEKKVIKKGEKKTVVTKPEVVKVPKRQLPVGQGKEKVSRLQARLKGALDKTSQEDIEELGLTTFRQMNQNDQIARATEYVTNNTEEALKVVRGEIDPPAGILQNSIFAALVALGEVDTDVATQVATLTATRFGQEINILKKILADNPVVMMQDIVKIRIEAYEKNTGNKVSEKVKQETIKITKKTQPTTKAQWDSFIQSIKC